VRAVFDLVGKELAKSIDNVEDAIAKFSIDLEHVDVNLERHGHAFARSENAGRHANTPRRSKATAIASVALAMAMLAYTPASEIISTE
jgi:hypothetical protein